MFYSLLVSQRYDQYGGHGQEAYDRACIDVLHELIQIQVEFDVNDEDGDGKTILMEIAEAGHLPLVKWLVNQGANVNAVTRKGDFALLNAALKGWQEVFDYLEPLTDSDLKEGIEGTLAVGLLYRQRKQNKLLESFVNAVEKGEREQVLLALENGVDVNGIASTGETALYLACQRQHVSIVHDLLLAGANPNQTNDGGQKPLKTAVRDHWQQTSKGLVRTPRSEKIIQILIDAGTSVFLEDIKYTISEGCSEQIIQLLEKATTSR